MFSRKVGALFLHRCQLLWCTCFQSVVKLDVIVTADLGACKRPKRGVNQAQNKNATSVNECIRIKLVYIQYSKLQNSVSYFEGPE
jgi:hypothetical protein